jgi:hypothetical protein
MDEESDFVPSLPDLSFLALKDNVVGSESLAVSRPGEGEGVGVGAVLEGGAGDKKGCRGDGDGDGDD